MLVGVFDLRGGCSFDNFFRLILFILSRFSRFCDEDNLSFCNIIFLLQLVKVLSLFVIISFSVCELFVLLKNELTDC